MLVLILISKAVTKIKILNIMNKYGNIYYKYNKIHPQCSALDDFFSSFK